MARANHGTGEQAIEWCLNHNGIVGLEAEAFLKAWQQGDAEAEWPEFYEWLDAQQGGPKLGDGTPDAALAIAEHAFRAGWDACWSLWRRVYPTQPDSKENAVAHHWDNYDPPEHIKALS